MAKINPIKLKQEADKHEKAGRLEPAIAAFRQIVEDNPRDWNSINKIGDLYAKLNRIKEASREYARVAEFYAKDGFLLKAIAIWKKINKLDTTALEPYLNLAELYGKQGLMMEAKSQYQFVVDEYVKRGKARDASDVLGKMVEIDPGDLKVRSKLADLYTRDGNTARAVEEYVAIAEELNKKGHLAEALQVLEKGLKLDSKSNRLREELARIHMVQKNFDRAAHYLEEAARGSPDDAGILGRLGEAYLGAHRIDEAEGIFQRLLEANPDDVDSRVQMGQVYLQRGQLDAAHDQIAPVVDTLIEKRQGDRAASLLQQLVQKNPSHVRSLVKLVEVYRQLQNDRAVASTYSQLSEAYLNQGDFDQAASVLEILVSMDPHNRQYQSKLDFVRNKQVSEPSGAAPPLELEAGEFDLSLEESPTEAPAAGGVGQAAVAPAAAADSAALEVPQIELSGPPSADEQEFIDEHLAEGKVFGKYGLLDKAIDQFQAVVARFPDHEEARRELAMAFEEKGEPLRAAEQHLALAEIHGLNGNSDAAQAARDEAVRLAPDAVPDTLAPAEADAFAEPEEPLRVEAGPGEFDLGEPAAAAPAGEEESVSLDDLEMPSPGGPGPAEEFSLDEEFPLEEEPAPGPAEESLDLGALDEPAGEPAGSDDLEEEFSLDGLDEPEAPESSAGPADALDEFDLGSPEPPAEPPPLSMDDLDQPSDAGDGFDLDALAGQPAQPAAEAGSPLDDLASGPEPAPGPRLEEDFNLGDFPQPPAQAPEEFTLGDALSVDEPAPAPAAPEPDTGLPAELRRVLDEVDSYISLGFVEDARDALRDIAGRFPEHEAISAKLAELGLDEASLATSAAAASHGLDEALGDLVHESAPAPAPAPDEGMVDLGAELGDLFGAQAAVEEPPAGETDLGDAGLSEIFKEFRKGVDQQLGQEDFDTRYNLGIAYKEMGLVDEAIAEFQLAAKDEARLLECASMLGICFMEKGMPALAVKWFERGLNAPGRSEEEYLGLRYDLASAYEGVGEQAKALEMFSELYGQDADFRDVAVKVRDLKAALG